MMLLEAVERNLSTHMYKYRRTLTQLFYNCKLCSASLTFALSDNKWRSSVFTTHRHGPQAKHLHLYSQLDARAFKECTYTYPLSVRTGDTLPSLQILINFLDKEASERNLPANIYRLYKNKKRTGMKCKICRVGIDIKKEVGGVTLISINNIHKHDRETIAGYHLRSRSRSCSRATSVIKKRLTLLRSQQSPNH